MEAAAAQRAGPAQGYLSMSEATMPSHATGEQRARPDRGPWLLRLMRLHFALAGIVLLLATLAFGWYVYTDDLDRISFGSGLRIEHPGDLYAPGTQRDVLLLLLLGIGAVVELWAAAAVRRDGGGPAVYFGAVGLLLGLPVAAILWGLELDVPAIAPDTVRLLLRVAAGLLAFQSLLALFYLVRLAFRRGAPTDSVAARAGWLGAAGLVLGLLIVGAVAVALALLTGWIERPVPDPEPGALLYVTTFDAVGGEWDTYQGRDAAQIVPVADLDPEAVAASPGALDGQVLLVTYGSPYSGEGVFSALDRMYRDFDLRVTAQMISGPLDNQYGVIFRYRDPDNYYGFLVGGDMDNVGWYALVKVQDGVLEWISYWGTSEHVRAGTGANEIRVVAVGDAFQFFVNGHLMPLCFKGENATSMWVDGTCFTDDVATTYRDADFSQGRIALMAGHSIDVSAPVVVAFDDVVIVGPEGLAPDDAAATAEPEAVSG